MLQRKTLGALAAATAASVAVVAGPEPASAHPVGVGVGGTENCSISGSHTTIRVSSRPDDGLFARCDYRRANGTGGSSRILNGTASYAIAPGVTRLRVCQGVQDSGTIVTCSSWIKA